jgi:acyl-CoA synthetase (AMP-forming)/AMP-acid ligase II
MPMGDMIRRSAHRFPEKTALVFRGSQVSYGELNRRVNSLAHSLLEVGIKKGDRVAVLTHNAPEFY